jgi:hypothetical protein
MKKQILVLSLITFCFSLFLTSCLKNKDKENFETEASDQSDDQTQFSAQVDAVSNDVNGVIELSGVGFRGGDIQDTCGFSFVIDSANGVRTITITYFGTDCFSRYSRTGVVTVSIPAGVRWKNAGATITVQYTNLVFTDLFSGKSITVNGSHTITNVSGGLLYQLATLNSITHTINSTGMTVTFADGTQRTWQVARQRVFTYNNGIVITVTGTHTEGNITNIAEWGTNRRGRAFTSAITEPLVVRQDCAFRLTSGKITHRLPAFTASATFGLDNAGNPTSCPGSGHYYVKIEWAATGGATHTALYPY